jgi:PBP1b-binding outer membrane lipoprotein LpoB
MKKALIALTIIASLLTGCAGSTNAQASKETKVIAEENLFNKISKNTRVFSPNYMPFTKYITNINENDGKLTIGSMVDFAVVDHEKDTVYKIDIRKETLDFIGIMDMASFTVHFIEDGKIYYTMTVLSKDYMNKNHSGVYSMDLETREVEKVLDIDCSAGYFAKDDDSYYLFGSKINYEGKDGDKSEMSVAPGHYRYSLEGKKLNDYNKLGEVKYISQEDGNIYYLTFDNKLYLAKKNGSSNKLIYDLSDKDIAGGFIVKNSKIYMVETYDHKIIDQSPLIAIPLSKILMLDVKSKELFTIKDGEKSIYQLTSSANNIYFSARNVDSELVDKILSYNSTNFRTMDLPKAKLFKINEEKSVEEIATIEETEIAAGKDKVYYWQASENGLFDIIEKLKAGELSIGVYEE